MKSTLLVISIGPIQDFISAARRTRDLWFGSFLLSEISKAVAKAIAEEGAELLFPALNKGDQALEPSKVDDYNVANIILAVIPPDADPYNIQVSGRLAALQCWKKYAMQVKADASLIVNNETWDDQVNDVLEFYSSWTPISGTYAEARKRVMRLLAGRKSCRDFLSAKGRAGLPKSSLDGARETVLIQDSKILSKELCYRLRLNSGEQLDSVGLIKRLGGERRQYPSVSRIAADPWLRGIALLAKTDKDSADDLTNLTVSCEKLSSHGLAKLAKANYPQFQTFPFDGAVLYPGRLQSFSEESGIDLSEFRLQLQKLNKKFGEPDPSLALLIADGDNMGVAISKLESIDENKLFSKQLARFAESSRKIVEKHFGCLIYAGGDDVMALLPVDSCISCARELHDEFGQLISKSSETTHPTLSVGIAIGHMMDPLEELLENARKAEKDAKIPNKNGLAIHLHTRGGAPVFVRSNWGNISINNPQSLDCRIKKWIQMYSENLLSDRTGYEIRNMALDYANWVENETFAIKHDLYRLLNKKRPSGKKIDLKEIEEYLEKSLEIKGQDDLLSKMYHLGLMNLACELLVARRIERVEALAKRTVKP